MNTDSAARKIAESLHRDIRAGRLVRVNFDYVRCAVAGYFVGLGELPTIRRVEDLENLALRRFVEKC